MEGGGVKVEAAGTSHSPPQLRPFEVPTDEDWAALRASERVRAAAERGAGLPVHAKTTASSRLQAAAHPQSEAAQELRGLLRREAAPVSTSAAAAGPELEPDYARRHPENLRDFVAKKRQIFLVQLGLDTKRSAMAKLESRMRGREAALKSSEEALEQDARRFDEYLQENDQKLQEAVRRAELEAKARQERAAEAKRLAASIAAMRSEAAKCEEQLQECTRYKAFLDLMTPEQWFEQRHAEREARKQALQAAWQGECAAIATRKAEAAEAKQRAEHEMHWARTQQQFERAEQAWREAGAALREAATLEEPPPPDLSALDAEAEGGEGMYFTDPAQLLAAFSQLEARSMFGIQAAQDAEQGLEAARAAHAAVAAQADAQRAALHCQVAELEAALATARDKCARLQQQAMHAQGGAGGGTGVGLAKLLAALAAAYEAAGFSADASMTPLQMLSKLEQRLEECLAGLAGVAPSLVEQVEKARERERRQGARQQKLAVQQAEHEARIVKVLERAAAPAFKKSGKPAMERSVVQPRQQAEGTGAGTDDADIELHAWMACVLQEVWD